MWKKLCFYILQFMKFQNLDYWIYDTHSNSGIGHHPSLSTSDVSTVVSFLHCLCHFVSCSVYTLESASQ